MTTDTVPKAASRRVTVGGATVTVTGIAKGAGMIQPEHGDDAGLRRDRCARERRCSLQAAVAHAADALVQPHHRRRRHLDQRLLRADRDRPRRACAEITDREQRRVSRVPRRASPRSPLRLAQAIVRDGEGATKFITVRVEGGRDEAECRSVAYAIAHSPLVKTAFFASDPNLGRILAAVGYAGIDDLDVDKVDLYLDDVLVAKSGGRNPATGRGRPARDEAERDHGARRARPRQRRGDRLDLRPLARLREHQRRLPQLMSRHGA